MIFSRKFASRIVTLTTLAIVCLIFYNLSYFDSDSTNLTNTKVIPPPPVRQLPLSPEQEFRRHWYRQRETRVNWERVLRPCKDNVEWGRVYQGWDKSQRTNASMSIIDYTDIRPAREFSRIFIHSRTKDGQIKRIGGDSWRVYLRGPSSIAATVFDHDNGTYEALVLIMEPGTYKLKVILDFSLCDGFREPPSDWFIKGNGQGKYQKEGLLGYLDDYLLETIDRNLTINIPKPRMTTPIENILTHSSCHIACDFLIDGFGRWINDRIWLPYLEESSNATVEPGRHSSGSLMSYGDSVALRFASSLSSNKKMCGELYKSCNSKYNWVYPVTTAEAEKKKNDDLDFIPDRIVGPIRQTLESPAMNNNGSLFVLNMGLHYVISLNLTTWQNLINKVIDLFLEKTNNNTDLKHKARVIWKTSTAITKENAVSLNYTDWRFFTSQRIILFESYATWAMCKAGIPVLNVYPASDSYAPGAGDVVHFPNSVFRNAEKALEIFKINDVNGKKRDRKCYLVSY